MTRICTIGHSNHPMERFTDLLHQHHITTLVDVRSRPYSRWAPHFQKASLAGALGAAGIAYVFLGSELGGRPSGQEFYLADGTINYERRAHAADFKAGIERVVELAGQGSLAVMCAEEDPARCHRRLLLTPALKNSGVVVVHLRGDGRLQPDEALPNQAAQLKFFR